MRIAEEDLDDESEAGSDSDGEIKSKTPKMIKKWVNNINKRPLKIEFAEDAQVRYKKRYGKDGTKNAAEGGGEVNGNENGEEGGLHPEPLKPRSIVAYDLPYGGPQLTGGIVKGTGKKTKF